MIYDDLMLFWVFQASNVWGQVVSSTHLFLRSFNPLLQKWQDPCGVQTFWRFLSFSYHFDPSQVRIYEPHLTLKNGSVILHSVFWVEKSCSSCQMFPKYRMKKSKAFRFVFTFLSINHHYLQKKRNLDANCMIVNRYTVYNKLNLLNFSEKNYMFGKMDVFHDSEKNSGAHTFCDANIVAFQPRLPSLKRQCQLPKQPGRKSSFPKVLAESAGRQTRLFFGI